VVTFAPGDKGSMPAENERYNAVLAAAAPGRQERIVALLVVLASAATLLLATPFARMPLGVLAPFIPAYQSALFITDLITAVLLYGQFARDRSIAIMVLASGYLFDAFIIVPHTLSFPGLFAATGLFGAGSQTTAWLYVFWHGGFAVFILAYAILARYCGAWRVARTGVALAAGTLGVLLLVALVTMLTTLGHDWLPVVIQNGDYSLLVQKGISPAICVLSLGAVAALWPQRRRSVIDLWLMVVLSAWICDVMLGAVVGSHRYDLGFYAGRAYGLLSASFLLIVLLIESNKLQLELIKSREALAKAQHFEAISQLTGGVAHDFNNLLMMITGALDIILRHPNDAARVTKWGQNALGAAGLGSKLTQQLLTFARRQVSRPQTVNVNKLLTDFDPLIRQAAGPNIRVEFALSPVLEPVRIDPAQFEAAILNLIVNARDATPSNGQITIETRNASVAEASGHGNRKDLRPGDYALIAVRDTGVGMNPEIATKAIDPFFTTKEVGRGSGLGLSQVYGFAKSFDGSLTIDSEVGSGTTITIYLPKSSEPLAEVVKASRTMPVRRASRAGDTVLVVEDEPRVLELAVQELKELGYCVLTASRAEQALEILRGDNQIDLLFSDIVMPGGMNGAQLAVEARRIRPDIKILLTSGYSSEALTSHGIPSDVDLLQKPYRRDELVERMRVVSN
jgi:signal transduction histidine kinase